MLWHSERETFPVVSIRRALLSKCNTRFLLSCNSFPVQLYSTNRIARRTSRLRSLSCSVAAWNVRRCSVQEGQEMDAESELIEFEILVFRARQRARILEQVFQLRGTRFQGDGIGLWVFGSCTGSINSAALNPLENSSCHAKPLVSPSFVRFNWPSFRSRHRSCLPKSTCLWRPFVGNVSKSIRLQKTQRLVQLFLTLSESAATLGIFLTCKWSFFSCSLFASADAPTKNLTRKITAPQ